eukprot:5520324-Pleurochrysis_carterae.AAC.4
METAYLQHQGRVDNRHHRQHEKVEDNKETHHCEALFYIDLYFLQLRVDEKLRRGDPIGGDEGTSPANEGVARVRTQRNGPEQS